MGYLKCSVHLALFMISTEHSKRGMALRNTSLWIVSLAAQPWGATELSQSR